MSNLTAFVIFAVYVMARTSLVAALEDERHEGFFVSALTVVGLATAAPL